MGKVHKLTDEIKNLILAEKKAHPTISCRILVDLLVKEKNIRISKSSINRLFKEAGLSLPPGRRQRKSPRPELKVKIEVSPLQAPPELATPEVKPEPAIAGELPVIPEPIIPAEVPEIKPEPKEETILPKKPEALEFKEEKSQPIAEQEVTKGELNLGTQTTGAILLAAADSLIGGNIKLSNLIRTYIKPISGEIFAKTKGLIFSSLFSDPPYTSLTPDSGLWTLINRQFVPADLFNYLNTLQDIKPLHAEMLRTLPVLFQQIRGVKILLSDGGIFYFDGEFHTIWSTQHIPYDFSTTLYNIKGYINRYFHENKPLLLFTAPGYDIPTNEFLDFLISLDSPVTKSISSFTFFGNQLEEIETLKPAQSNRQYFVFGFWPWQFVQYRKVNKIKEFKPLIFEPLQTKLYFAEVDISLLQPSDNKEFRLRGCALKTNLTEKTRFLILTNLPSEVMGPEELCIQYLNKWPNLEEGFQDYSHKIELFTYTASSQHFFSSETIIAEGGPPKDMLELLHLYLKLLDAYVRAYFFPVSAQNKNFSKMVEQFYNLKVTLSYNKNSCFVKFELPSQYPWLQELSYACNRFNEKEIISSEGKRLWFII